MVISVIASSTVKVALLRAAEQHRPGTAHALSQRWFLLPVCGRKDHPRLMPGNTTEPLGGRCRGCHPLPAHLGGGGGREITQHPALWRFVSLSSLDALYAAVERWLALNFLPSRISILCAGEIGH